MTAVVGPVGVDHTDFRDGRITVFGIPEIFLTELDITQIHCQTVVLHKLIQFCCSQINETGKCFNGCRNLIICIEGFRQFHSSLTAFYGVDEVSLYLFKFSIGNITDDHINLCRAYTAAFTLQEDLNTLFAAVRSLVKLTRQIFHRKHALASAEGRQFLVNIVNCRFGEHGRDCFFKCFFGQLVRIITIENTDTGYTDTQCGLKVAQYRLGFHRIFRLFFHIDSINRHSSTPLCWICMLPQSADQSSTQHRSLLF